MASALIVPNFVRETKGIALIFFEGFRTKKIIFLVRKPKVNKKKIYVVTVQNACGRNIMLDKHRTAVRLVKKGFLKKEKKNCVHCGGIDLQQLTDKAFKT